jgi:hypothetical protein
MELNLNNDKFWCMRSLGKRERKNLQRTDLAGTTAQQKTNKCTRNAKFSVAYHRQLSAARQRTVHYTVLSPPPSKGSVQVRGPMRHFLRTFIQRGVSSKLNFQAGGPPLSVVRKCLFNFFAATICAMLW